MRSSEIKEVLRENERLMKLVEELKAKLKKFEDEAATKKIPIVNSYDPVAVKKLTEKTIK